MSIDIKRLGDDYFIKMHQRAVILSEKLFEVAMADSASSGDIALATLYMTQFYSEKYPDVLSTAHNAMALLDFLKEVDSVEKPASPDR